VYTNTGVAGTVAERTGDTVEPGRVRIGVEDTGGVSVAVPVAVEVVDGVVVAATGRAVNEVETELAVAVAVADGDEGTAGVRLAVPVAVGVMDEVAVGAGERAVVAVGLGLVVAVGATAGVTVETEATTGGPAEVGV